MKHVLAVAVLSVSALAACGGRAEGPPEPTPRRATPPVAEPPSGGGGGVTPTPLPPPSGGPTDPGPPGCGAYPGGPTKVFSVDPKSCATQRVSEVSVCGSVCSFNVVLLCGEQGVDGGTPGPREEYPTPSECEALCGSNVTFCRREPGADAGVAEKVACGGCGI